ncbi:MAG: phenylalanine--tRNA ligase subunit beta [Nanoarchaeota archaeon]|nr:phenylalanine--tRNA ligase subunit beta [Nanoarchaeota archaeon]
MANIKIPRKIFEKEVGKLDEKMQDRITMFGTPVEEITNDEFQIEVFPNRPDLLSYQGFKRSFLSFLEKKTKLKEYKINKPEKNYKVNIDSSVKNIRPFTACAIVKRLKLNDEKIKELIEIQEKLHITVGRKRKKVAIGIYPLEKIKLPITFKALEPDKIKFIPLESNREMSGLEILQRHPTGKEYSHLLAGKEKFPIFIDADKNILSMPPIINSQLTGKITEETKEVFIECSGFDFEILSKCLNILVTSLAEMGGEIYQMELLYGKKKITPNLSTEKMKISLENTNKLLGLNINEKELKKLIEKMGYNYDKGLVEIPSWRTDILHEVDLIEDVAIAYGYENFVPEIPKISTIGEENPRETFKRKFSEILAGLGILEISNYHLTTKKDQFTKMGISEKQEKDFIEVEESKTEYSILRGDLTHYLLKIFSENIDSEYPQKIFEIGKVFELKETISETENLAIAFTPGNFTEIKQVLEYLSKMINIKMEILEPQEITELPNHFIEGRVAEIKIEEKNIGFIGEIHPKILKNWKIRMPVALLEINLEEIFKQLN